MSFLDFLKQRRKERAEGHPLTDKVFMQSIALSALAMLVCITMLTATTWAWFSSGVCSGQNTITTNFYTIDVEMRDSADTVLVGTESASTITYLLEAGVEYTLTITATGDGNGYCIICVDGAADLYTDLIPTADPTRNPTVLTFSYDHDVVVEVTSCWGIYDGAADLYQNSVLS